MRNIILTALDIGTYSIKGVCAQKNLSNGEISVLAQSQFSCFGVRNGEVSHPEKVSEILKKLKEDLSQKAGVKIKDVLVNIGGGHLFSVTSEGVVSVSRADQKISREDLSRVIKQARAINLPSNKEILETFPKEFIVDGEGGIKNPLGLQGMKLQTKVLLVCLFSPILENLEKAVSDADLEIVNVFSSPLAASRACLTPQQKELGVVLVDIGAGSTGTAVYEKGDLVDFSVFPIGSANITNDIAITQRTEISTAERVKREFATLKKQNGRKKEKITIPEKSLEIPSSFLKKVVEARVSEIFSEVGRTVKKISKDMPLPGGVVLTGGGSSLPGVVDFAKQKLKLPCRLCSSGEINQLDQPEFSVCAGLLLSSLENEDGAFLEGPKMKEKGRGFFRKIFKVFIP